MAKHIALTRPALKRHRDALHRFQRYLPMLKLKQQQLQLTLRQVKADLTAVEEARAKAQEKFAPYETLLSDVAGLNVRQLAEPQEVRSSSANIAGVTVPVFEEALFPPADYSLFATPPWVDRVLADLRDIARLQAERDLLKEKYDRLHRELIKIIQRVNLFEKVKIPDAREAIRIIRIKLGDEMTAGVGRAKIAKGKIAESESARYGPEESNPEVKAG